MPAVGSQAGGGGLPLTRKYRSERHSATACTMSTATLWLSPLRSRQISAAASAAAAMEACAAAATRNDDGRIGSAPVNATAPSAVGSLPASVQRSARISRGACMDQSRHYERSEAIQRQEIKTGL